MFSEPSSLSFAQKVLSKFSNRMFRTKILGSKLCCQDQDKNENSHNQSYLSYDYVVVPVGVGCQSFRNIRWYSRVFHMN